jgi:hypothetical protein
MFTAITATRTFMRLLVGHPSLQNGWVFDDSVVHTAAAAD